MGTLVAWLISLVAVGVPVAAAMVLRKQRLMSQRRLVRDGVVVAAGVIGLAIAVVVTRAMATPAPAPRTDDVFAGLCATPAAGDEAAKAFHELACSPKSRVADLRGTNEYQGVWAHFVANEAAFAVFAPRPDLVPDVPQGKSLRLWLLDRAGTVVEAARLDRSMSTFVRARPNVTQAVKAVITFDAPAATQPSGAPIVQGTLAPL